MCNGHSDNVGSCMARIANVNHQECKEHHDHYYLAIVERHKTVQHKKDEFVINEPLCVFSASPY